MDPEKHTGEKAWLVFWSLSAGILAWLASYTSLKENAGHATLLGLCACFGWPVIGAFVIRFCESLKGWAYCGKKKPWPDDERLMLAGVWPLTFVCCSVVYLSLGIIHRIF